MDNTVRWMNRVAGQQVFRARFSGAGRSRRGGGHVRQAAVVADGQMGQQRWRSGEVGKPRPGLTAHAAM